MRNTAGVGLSPAPPHNRRDKMKRLYAYYDRHGRLQVRERPGRASVASPIDENVSVGFVSESELADLDAYLEEFDQRTYYPIDESNPCPPWQSDAVNPLVS